MTHIPTGVVVESEQERSQWQNRRIATERLAAALNAAAQDDADRAVQAARGGQVNSERSGKGFTHNEQRDEVVRHSDGRRWRTRDFRRGNLD